MNPDTFSEGGLLDDADVTVKEAAFVLWNYGKENMPTVPALGVTFVDGEGKEHDQYYSAGDKKYFIPSDDGECLVPVGDKTTINSNTNAAQFVASLVDAGFPKDKLDEGTISTITGMNCHVHRQAQPKRSGLAQAARADGREPTILLVDKINSLPGEKPGKGMRGAQAAPKAAAKSPSEEAGAEAASDDLTNRTQEIVLGFLGEGPVTKAQLPQLIFKQVPKTDPDRAAMLALVYRDEFLKAGPWQYSGGRLSLE